MFPKQLPGLVDEDGRIVKPLAFFLVKSQRDHQTVLAGECGDAIAIRAGDGHGHAMRVRILPAQNYRFRKRSNVRPPGASLLKRILDAAEISFPITINSQDLADGNSHGQSALLGPGERREQTQEECHAHKSISPYVFLNRFTQACSSRSSRPRRWVTAVAQSCASPCPWSISERFSFR